MEPQGAEPGLEPTCSAALWETPHGTVQVAPVTASCGSFLKNKKTHHRKCGK